MELHSSFTTLDFIVLAIILISGLLAILSGFVREMVSLFNWVASYFVAIHFYPMFEPFLKRYIHNATTVTDTAIFLMFCLSFIVLALLGNLFTDFIVQGKALTTIDRSLGFVFGLVRGALVVCLIYLVATSVLWPDLDKPQEPIAIDTNPQEAAKHETRKPLPPAPEFIMEAKTRPMMAAGANILKEFVPQKLLEKTTEEILSTKNTTEKKINHEIEAAEKPAILHSP